MMMTVTVKMVMVIAMLVLLVISSFQREDWTYRSCCCFSDSANKTVSDHVGVVGGLG